MADKKNPNNEEKKIEQAKPATAEKKKDMKNTQTAAKKPTKKDRAVQHQKAKKAPKAERKVVLDPKIDPFAVVQYVLMTEKCVRMIESQNKLVFAVRRNADKKDIRKAVENAFQSPVANVTTMIDQQGRKRAFVRFSTANAAGDIAIRLGII